MSNSGTRINKFLSEVGYCSRRQADALIDQGRVYVNFIISKDGSISNIRMRGPDKNLEKEAARIIGKLPNMTPGKQRGRPVRVPFSIPITFKLQ